MTLFLRHNSIERTGSSNQPGFAGRFSLFVCIVVLSAACADGYPDDSESVLMPAEMTQSQRVQQMNQIGQQAYLGTRWRYKLTELCDLEIATGRLLAKESTVVSLKRGQVIKSVDRADKTHDVHLQHINVLTPLLETASWADSVTFYTLVSHVQRDCIPGERA